MGKNKLPFAMTLTLLLSACSGSNLHISTTPTTPEITIPAHPRPPQFEPVSVMVLTKDNINTIVSEISKVPDTTFVVFAPQSYENLLNNIGELKRYNQQSDILVQYYEQTIKNITTGDNTSKSKR